MVWLSDPGYHTKGGDPKLLFRLDFLEVEDEDALSRAHPYP